MRPINAPYQYRNILATTATPAALATASGTLRHRVLGLAVTASGAQQVTLQSSTGGALLGPIAVAAGWPHVLPPSPIGYAEGAAGRGVYCSVATTGRCGISAVLQTYAATRGAVGG